MDRTLFYAQLLGEVVLDKLMVDHRKTDLFGKACRDILTERPHLSRHCDHSHGILLLVPGASADRCTSAPVAAQRHDQFVSTRRDVPALVRA